MVLSPHSVVLVLLALSAVYQPLLSPQINQNLTPRQRLAREKDKELRDAARVTLVELEETLSQGLALIASQRQHPGIKPQADKGMQKLDA